MNQAGKNPTPITNAELNLVNEISEDTDVSNNQMIKGSNKNMTTPLALCKMETQPAAGNLYVVRSLNALMFLN
jgi:hypothetical protein